MRALTTQTEREVRTWLKRLELEDPPTVHVVMGGEVDDAWLGTADRDAVIVGTQDLLLSAALNRGFAMSRYAWPMAFGLLHNDVQWILDEVQLMGVGSTTSAQLDAFRTVLGTFGPSRSLWMSATLEPGRLQTVDRNGELDVFALEPPEAAELAPLLNARKPVARLRVEADDARSVAAHVLKDHVTGTRTVVVVNTVQRAQSLYRELRRRVKGETVALLHSRFRPGDRGPRQKDVLEADWSGILVATQVVEAGVDISARLLVTELAPWSSVVQRLGRCNRRGERDDAAVRWIDLDDSAAAPYEPEALAAARKDLERLRDGSPSALTRHPHTQGTVVLPVIRRRDLIDLFDTTPDLSGADLDVSPYVRGEDETDVFVAWRDFANPTEAPAAETPQPDRVEQCRVPVGLARKFLERLRADGGRAWRWDHRMEQWLPVQAASPGQVWLVPRSAGGYDAEVGFDPQLGGDVPVLESSVVPPAAEGEGADRRSMARTAETLEVHTEQVVRAIQRAADAMGSLSEDDVNVLILAARWHDAGKAHPVFQQTMYGGGPEGRPVLAKSSRGGRHERRGFRHEVASALMLLAQAPNAFPSAYLVAAHHGRARVVVRARPGEPAAPDGRSFVLGVWSDDEVPEVGLGGGVVSTRMVLDPSRFAFGGSDSQPGWTAQATQLRDRFGPFRLAFMETVLRVADWHASATGAEGGR